MAKKKTTPPQKSGQSSPQLVVETVPLSSLKPDPKNARTHDKQNLDAIASSLRKFGQRKPIVVGKGNVVLAGNGAFLAAQKLGWKSIQVVRADLSAAEARAYSLADNRTSELSSWDYQTLAGHLGDLKSSFDLSELGWTPEEVDTLLAAEWQPPPPTDLVELAALHRVAFSERQWKTITKAIEKTKTKDMDDAQAITAICGRVK